MPEAHKAVLALLCKDREKWFTRREVCEAKGIAWGDRGGSPEARKVWQSLKALARDGFADEGQQGREATFRAAGIGTPAPLGGGDGTSHGTQLMESMESMESSSDTKGFHDSVRLESMESRADVLPGHHGSPVLDSIDSKATESSDQLQGLVDSIDSIDSRLRATPNVWLPALLDLRRTKPTAPPAVLALALETQYGVTGVTGRLVKETLAWWDQIELTSLTAHDQQGAA